MSNDNDKIHAMQEQTAGASGFEIVVRYDGATGSVTVQGPLINPALCIGILEAAKYTVQKFADEQVKVREGRVVIPPAGMRA